MGPAGKFVTRYNLQNAHITHNPGLPKVDGPAGVPLLLDQSSTTADQTLEVHDFAANPQTLGQNRSRIHNMSQQEGDHAVATSSNGNPGFQMDFTQVISS